MIDPIELAKKTAEIVARNNERKYYRFRPAGFYGGIATADCVGCNLRCIFCWAWNVVNNPTNVGKFYPPEYVSQKTLSIARKKGFKKIRISGNEPTIVKEHLIETIEKIPKDFLFILETNGILIGYDKKYASEINFENVHVRVSLKGANEKEFSTLTGASPKFFSLQLSALKNLLNENLSFHPAIMTFEKEEKIKELYSRLDKIDESLKENLEFETIIPYPDVVKRLRNAGIEI